MFLRLAISKAENYELRQKSLLVCISCLPCLKDSDALSER